MSLYAQKNIKISVLIPFLVFILFFSVMIWQKYRSSYEIPPVPLQQNVEGDRTVTLFFVEDGTRLAREAREIDSCSDDNDCLKKILEELLNGPVGEFDEPIPDGTLVEDTQLEGGLATINFNNTFSAAMISGSSAEMLAVYSVVDTVAANFPQIKKVKLNIAGNSSAVLRHLDLSGPLEPDYSMESPAAVEKNNTTVDKPTNIKGSMK